MFIIFTLLMLATQNYIQSADQSTYTVTFEENEIEENGAYYKQFKFSVATTGKVQYTPTIEIRLNVDSLRDVNICTEPALRIIEFKKSLFIYALLKRSQEILGDTITTDYGAILFLPVNYNKGTKNFLIGRFDGDIAFCETVGKILDGQYKEDACVIKSYTAKQKYTEILAKLPQKLEELPIEFKSEQ